MTPMPLPSRFTTRREKAFKYKLTPVQYNLKRKEEELDKTVIKITIIFASKWWTIDYIFIRKYSGEKRSSLT